MGRKLNTSQPTVIETMLTPLNECFAIEATGDTQQWYYVNTGEYSPNRITNPLVLTPALSCADEESGMSYTPLFSSVVWYYYDATNNTDYSQYATWPGIGWIPVTATSDGDNVYMFVPSSDNPQFKLYVKKNVPPESGGLNIYCAATYIDPRDSGVSSTVTSTQLLVTSKDASSNIIRVNILSPVEVVFNPFTSEQHVYEFEAQLLDKDGVDVTSEHYIEWYGDVEDSKNPVLINTLPCYFETAQPSGKGQGTNKIKLDAMFVENIKIVCRIRTTTSSSSAILPDFGQTTLLWEFPRIDASTCCRNGRVVNYVQRYMEFFNIVNHAGGVLSDDKIKEHLLFHWTGRVPRVVNGNTSFYDADYGWGPSICISSEELRQSTTYATPVHADIYIKGAYQPVTYGGEPVTYGGETVYARQ